MLPIFFRKECNVLVVGGGKVALRKTTALLQGGARITLQSPEICPALEEFAKQYPQKLIFKRTSYVSFDLACFDLIFACTNHSSVNQQVANDAAAASVPVNVADDPARCDFFMPASAKISTENLPADNKPSVESVSQGEIQLALFCTGAPALASALRDLVCDSIPPHMPVCAKALALFRNSDCWRSCTPELRQTIMRGLVELVLSADSEICAADYEKSLQYMLDYAAREKSLSEN